jgi:glycosyltransferase involved in cell wall biosynthesis
MSLSLLEALASARSVVVTDVSGMREVVSGGVGAVAPQDSPDALASALVARLADPSTADGEGKLGRARIEERHDLRVQHQNIALLYDELLAARGGVR